MVVKKHPYYLLLTVVCLSTIGVAIPYPIFAPYFLTLSQGAPHLIALSSGNWMKISLGITLAAYPLGQFFGAPIIGKLSDYYGRKLLLQYSLLGAVLGYFITSLSIFAGNIYLLVISRFITGILESNFAVAQALIIDNSKNKEKDLGGLSAVTSLGYVVGPLLGGLLSNPTISSLFNYSTPFYFISALSFALFLFIRVFLKEQKDPNKKKKQIHANEKLTEQLNLFKIMKGLFIQRELKWLLVSALCVYLAITSYYEFYPVILTTTWQMNATGIAILTTVLSLCISGSALLLPNFLKGKVKQKFSLCSLLSCLTVGYLLLLSTDVNEMYVQFVVVGIAIGAVSTIQTVLISNATDEKKQGEVLGIANSLRNLGNAIMCLAGGFLIVFSTQLPIMIASCFILLGLFFYWVKVDFHANS